MSEDALVIRQPALGEDVDRVADTLTDAYAQMREAVAAGRPLVLVLDDRDVLGQGSVADAGVAAAMLGVARAFALEGAKPGWSTNTVTHRGVAEDEPKVAAAVDWLAGSGLSGQLIRIGTDHIGKVSP